MHFSRKRNRQLTRLIVSRVMPYEGNCVSELPGDVPRSPSLAACAPGADFTLRMIKIWLWPWSWLTM